MSGSSGSAGYGAGFGEAPTECSRIDIQTQISSPKAQVVAKLRAGDELAVELRNEGATKTIVLVLGRDIAGGLATPEMQKLRECLESGVQFKATVKAIQEGQVKVRVIPA